jgi:TPR repeat protein
MKPMLLIWNLALLLALAVTNLPAQQTDADRKLFQQIKADAEKGDASAQILIGGCYEGGLLSTSIDSTEAAKWYRNAAEQGLPLASSLLERFTRMVTESQKTQPKRLNGFARLLNKEMESHNPRSVQSTISARRLVTMFRRISMKQ